MGGLVRGAAPRGVRQFFFREDASRRAGGPTRAASGGGRAPCSQGEWIREDGQLSVQLAPVGAESQAGVGARGTAEDPDVLGAHKCAEARGQEKDVPEVEEVCTVLVDQARAHERGRQNPVVGGAR